MYSKRDEDWTISSQGTLRVQGSTTSRKAYTSSEVEMGHSTFTYCQNYVNVDEDIV